MSDDKTRLIDNRETKLIKDDTTRLIQSDETKLLDKDKTILIHDESVSIMEKAFIGLSLHGYVIDRLLSDKGGEAYILVALKDGKEYVAKVYREKREGISNKILSIDSKYVAKIIDSGQIRGQYFEIMPYYKEGTLQDNIKKLDIAFIKNVVVKELNEGLKAIHDIGIVHNDIKPHNIFLSEDKKHVIIGDFGVINDLNGRDYATKYVGGLSEVFSAPEAYRYSSNKVDYYSLGMTLYHLSYGGDPFKDMSNDRVRGMIANDAIEIDSSIDSQLADLIYMLIKNSPKDRIGYDGVNAWINNKDIYHSERIKQMKIKEKDFIISHEFDGKMYASMIELTEAMNNNYDLGYKHFINDFLLDDVKKAFGKQELAIELKDIRKKYNDNLDLAYFITLHKLNNDLEFVYKGKNYKNFKNYLNEAFSNYVKFRKNYIDIKVLDVLVNDDKIKNILNKIDGLEAHNEVKFDMLLNYFTNEEKIYYNGKVYESLKEFSCVLFENFNVNELVDISAFEDLLEYKYNFKKFDKSKEKFSRYACMSKCINGYVRLEYAGNEFRNTRDIIKYMNDKIKSENKIVYSGNLLRFMRSNIKEYYLYEESKNEKFMELIESLSNKSDKEFIYGIYLATSEYKKYYFNDQSFESVSELVNYLGKVADLDKISTSILNDTYFYMWLKAMGYEVKEEL